MDGMSIHSDFLRTTESLCVWGQLFYVMFRQTRSLKYHMFPYCPARMYPANPPFGFFVQSTLHKNGSYWHSHWMDTHFIFFLIFFFLVHRRPQYL